jgi:glutamate racemase
LREPPSADRPIGVFDSGVGGLTVLRALAARLPNEDFIYLGDTARLPYGTKSPATVERYFLQCADALAAHEVKCLVVACNTASSVGLTHVRERITNLPVVGVIEPGAEAACAASKSGHIAVIATERTVNGGAYQEAILRRRGDARITALATPLFVALAEEGLCHGPIAEGIARHYLDEMFVNRLSAQSIDATVPDTLLLGCTHFPMLAETIRRVVGSAVSIVDSAATTAASVARLLTDTGLSRSSGTRSSLKGSARFLATDSIERFVKVGGGFLDRRITPDEVELVDLVDGRKSPRRFSRS